MLAKPEANIVDLLSKPKLEDAMITHDEDFTQQAEENDAIETIVADIDNSVFEKFYQFSYIKDGNVKNTSGISEELKVQFITDMIIADIEQLGLNRQEYTDSDLNSGLYSQLTREANQLEKSYIETKDKEDSQTNISLILKILSKRLEAYEDKRTSNLAHLIGNTYVLLSTHQTVNDNIISNCDSIKYYIESCQLNIPNNKRDSFYEIGVRFNCISEIARGVYCRESSDEYRSMFMDSLYMSIAYYKLYRDSFVEDFKNNYYLARNYKLLADNMTDDTCKIMYYEKALSILHTLEKYDNLSRKSRYSICNLIYNTLNGYKAISQNYWNDYTISSLTTEMDNKKKEMNSF